MDLLKLGKVIFSLREKNGLVQQQSAQKLHSTYHPYQWLLVLKVTQLLV